MTENTSSKHQNTQPRDRVPETQMVETAARARYAFWSSVIMMAAGLVLSVYRVFLITTSPVGDWRDYASLALTGSLCVMGVVSIWLSRRGRITLGISLVIGVFLVMLLIVPALQHGLGMLCGVCAFTITAVIAQQIFPSRAAGWVTVIGGITGVAAFLIDLYWPLERLASSETLTTLGIILASGTILIYMFSVVQQFTNYALGTKLALGFLIITLIAVASGFLSLSTYKNINAEFTLLHEDVVPGELSILKSETALANFLMEVEKIVLSGDTSQWERARAQSIAMQESLAERITIVKKAGGEEYQDMLALQDQVEQISNMGEQVKITVKAHANAQAKMQSDLEQMSAEIKELVVIMDEHVTKHMSELAASEQAIDHALASGGAIDEEFNLLIEDVVPGALSMLKTSAALEALRGEVKEMALSGDTSQREYIDKAIASIQANTAEHAAHEIQVGEEEGAVAQDMENRAASIISLAEQVMDEIETNAQKQTETENLMSQMRISAETLATTFREDAVRHESEVDVAKAAVDQTTTTGNTVAWATMIVAVALALVVGFFLTRAIVGPIVALTTTTESLERGDLGVVAEVTSGDEIGVLAGAFNSMTARLQRRTRDVEQRTRDVEQRSAYLEGSADISRAAASILESDVLIRQVVELIKEQFDLYYVGLFLVDEKHEWAVLQAGTGEAGRKMLARNHRLKIGEGMIGWSIANAEARIALDVGEDAVRFENPDLPETRSEGALPLRSRGRVLGALTVQSTAPAAFNQDILTTLQTMSDQIAVALDNAELLAKSEAALEAERRAYGELSHEAWVTLSRSQAVPGYLVTAEGNMHPIKGQQASETTQVIQNKPVLQNDGLTAIIPIKSHGRVLGGIKIRKGNDTWTQAEVELAETLSEQLGVALESARLYQDTQRRAARERLTGEVTARMRETLDMDTILQTAVREIGDALGIAEVEVRMGKIAPIKNVTTEGDLP